MHKNNDSGEDQNNSFRHFLTGGRNKLKYAIKVLQQLVISLLENLLGKKVNGTVNSFVVRNDYLGF